MSNHVEGGVLVRSSPSAIVTFDDKTPFGCPRKWFFEHVLNLESEDAEHLIFGTEFHSGVENVLTQGLKPFTARESSKARIVAMVNAGRHIIDEVRTRTRTIESWMDLALEGVTLKGRIDVETGEGILDWKTSSNVAKYAKTAGQLRTDTQMLLYAERARRIGSPWQVLEHVTFQSKGSLLVEHTKAKIDAATLDTGLERIISLLGEMKDAAKASSVSDIKPTADKQKCNRCPFQPSCPQGNPRMSLMSILSKNAAPTPASTPAPAPVVPPDAPKSDPAQAAKPVAGFEPVPPPKKNKAPIVDVVSTPEGDLDEEAVLMKKLEEAKAKKAEAKRLADEAAAKAKAEAEEKAKVAEPEVEPTTEKRGPGRPPGAKNKPKGFDARIQTVTITRGGTVNMGNFQSARFEVSMSIACDEDVDAATKYLDEKVTTLVMNELGRLEAAAQESAKAAK